jgi:hypothetical protein
LSNHTKKLNSSKENGSKQENSKPELISLHNMMEYEQNKDIKKSVKLLKPNLAIKKSVQKINLPSQSDNNDKIFQNSGYSSS